MREIIWFSENHPAILVSEIVAIMPPKRVDPLNESSTAKPDFWRVTFGMRGGSTVHVDIYPSDFTPTAEQIKEASEDPLMPLSVPVPFRERGKEERAKRFARIMFVEDVATEFFKSSVETWKYWEE